MKKPQEWGGHDPRYAAVPQEKKTYRSRKGLKPCRDRLSYLHFMQQHQDTWFPACLLPAADFV